VLDLIRQLGARGISVLVVSHNLVDVFAVADRLAVLYLGQMVSTGPITEYDTQSAVELMTTGTLSNPDRAVTPTASADGATEPTG
jgi:ABC-type sugar transport system ATPase subunit